MRTDELVERLSQDPRPRQRLRPAVVMLMAMIIAVAAAVALSFLWLGTGDLTAHTATHERTVKLIFAGGVIVAALVFVRDLSVPGRRTRLPTAVVLLPFVLMLAFAVHEIMVHAGDAWPTHLTHTSWLMCLGHIAALALPAFAVLAFAMRRLAPVRLRHAGFYVGLAAGGIGALGYALHAHEEGIAFSLAAYTSAILLLALLGAWLGPRILRWS